MVGAATRWPFPKKGWLSQRRLLVLTLETRGLFTKYYSINQISAQYGISPVVLSRWKKEFLERASEVFKKGPSEAEKELTNSKEHIAELERKVGQLSYEVDWLKKKSEQILGPDWKKKSR